VCLRNNGVDINIDSTDNSCASSKLCYKCLSIGESNAENWTEVTLATSRNDTRRNVVVDEGTNRTGSLGETCLDDEGT
jgi:hypothetical protein